MSTALRYTVRSDVGLLRDGNEDSAYAGPHLQAIADGMGGHAAGEVASAAAIDAMAPLDADPAGLDRQAILADAIGRAQAALRQITQSDPATTGMGTTLTALLWSGNEVTLCHIGDSRAYLLRDGSLRQISHDHTLVQSLVDEGRLTPEAAASHPQRSLVMRALQGSIDAEPDMETLDAQVGDRYLLCSDGLSDVVSDETIGRTLADFADQDEAVDHLVDLAIRSGGPDNITVILADVIDTDLGQEPTDTVIKAGAVADDGADGEPVRGDSPATRAHMLARELTTPPEGIPAVRENLTVANEGFPVTNGSARTDGADGADRANGSAAEDLGGNRAALFFVSRRRWPVVTTILLVLFAVIGAAGVAGWRFTQDEYYVGAADGRVVVFRGINDTVGGVSLSSVVQRTDIPVAAMPAGEAGLIKATIPAETFGQAQLIVWRIGRDYQCAVVHARISTWLANRPPSQRPTARPHLGARHTAPTRQHPATVKLKQRPRSTSRARTSRPAAAGQAPYPVEPALPSYCSAYSWGSR